MGRAAAKGVMRAGTNAIEAIFKFEKRRKAAANWILRLVRMPATATPSKPDVAHGARRIERF